jgi:hypothetical protein
MALANFVGIDQYQNGIIVKTCFSIRSGTAKCQKYIFSIPSLFGFSFPYLSVISKERFGNPAANDCPVPESSWSRHSHVRRRPGMRRRQKKEEEETQMRAQSEA